MTDTLIKVNEAYGEKEDLEFEDLGKLVYLEQCMKETLRLHPPATMTFRKTHHRSETVNDVLIPKGNWELFVNMVLFIRVSVPTRYHLERRVDSAIKQDLNRK